ncbi:MAG: hypothetical protein IPQ24_12680 [Anaeromyxobacter sp.]|nr:hypothetical protein [Anaeromyxobacter sp.]
MGTWRSTRTAGGGLAAALCCGGARAQVSDTEVTLGMSALFSGVAKELGGQMRWA